jgi:TPR repeat protein
MQKRAITRTLTIAAVAVATVVALFVIEEAYFYFGILRPGVAKMIAVARAGDPAMQTEVGMLYQQGGIPRRLALSGWPHVVAIPADPSSAAFWYQRAAEQNYSKAEWLFSLLIASGTWIHRDDEQVVHWMQRSADHGNDTGQWLLGKMYENGYNGVEKDRAKAVEWYRKAAAQGHPYAIERIRAIDAR